MNNNHSVPICFGDLVLKLKCYFSKEDNLDKVKVEICTLGQVILYKFDLKDQVEPIDTRSNSQSSITDIKGAMYLDISREKIILDGIYFENKKQKGTFWLEIVTYPDSSIGLEDSHEISIGSHETPLNCSDHPVEIGTLQFKIGSNTVAVNNNGDKNLPNTVPTITILENNLTLQAEAEKKTYLSASLFENMTIGGIDTSSQSEEGHDVDFSGEVGLYHNNRLFIDGDLKYTKNNRKFCDFYLELR